MKCRVDGSHCKTFLDLGKMPIANGFFKKNDKKKEYFFNLKAAFNEKLSLFQIVEFPSPKKMFNKNYPFFSSSSQNMIDHFKKFSDFIKKKYLNKNSLILEIGSNDGTFLKNFDKKRSYGFEPSRSVHLKSKEIGVNSINKFFNLKNISSLKSNFGKFDVISGANVFCHIPNQIDLIKSIDKLLSKKGTLILEEPYLGAMYEKTSYDQIYDEHIYMFSLSSIQKLYDLFGFELIDALPQKTHGGSMRYIIKRKNITKKTTRLLKLLKFERNKKIDKFSACLSFKKKVIMSKKLLRDKILKILNSKNKICGYGATSKSTTILNYCKINKNMIDCIYDTTKNKIGKLTPGTHIPVLNYKLFKHSNYKYVFLFAWNHKSEILKKEKNKKNIIWFNHLN